MQKMKEGPAPIKRRLFITGLIGILCLLVGVVFFLLFRDKMMLFLSLAVCALSLAKAWEYYRTIAGKKYETVEGICVAVMPKPFRRYRKIKIMDEDGNESSMLVDKRSKVKIGARYRFYFKATQRLSFGSEYLESALSSDCFLGYEELQDIASGTTE